MAEHMTGAASLIKSLEHAGVDTVFGIPGGAILPAYDPLMDSDQVRHILVRHEQGAGHAAEGYAQTSGKVGVCMATSGPGATNLVTPIADAYMDSVPIVAITGQVPSAAIGTDAFQEADISGITMPIVKHNYLVTDPAEIPRVIAEAFHLAGTGRPGPVLVDISKDALAAQTTFEWPDAIDLPGYRPTTAPHGKQIKEAAKMIVKAKRPVLYVGGGIVRSGASQELLTLAELTGIPVVTTLMARGAFPDSHPQNLGMPGMHGTVPAVGALQKSDLLIALGTRFDDRVTGKLDSFAPDAKVIHADIDPAEIGKNRHADVPIVGDAKATIAGLIAALSGRKDDIDIADWWEILNGWKKRFPRGYEEHPDALEPQYVIERLGHIAGPDAIYCAGVGQRDDPFDETVPAGVLISATPQVAPDATGQVPKSTPVDLVISAGPAPRKVPVGLVGQSAEAASQILASVQLGMNRIDEFSDQPVGTVVRLGQPENTELPRDSAVDVVVSIGPETFPIPDVRGQSGTQAEATLNAAGFSIAGIDGAPSAAVVGQRPQPGELHVKGTAVQLLTSRA